MECDLIIVNLKKEHDKKELKEHLVNNGYYSTYNIENNTIYVDYGELSYIITILNDRNINFIIKKEG